MSLIIHKDNEGITEWNMGQGLPKLSPHFLTAARNLKDMSIITLKRPKTGMMCFVLEPFCYV